MDSERDVKMDPVSTDEKKEVGPSQSTSTSNGNTNPGGQPPVMVMPTGPAPIISNKHPVMHLNELTQDSVYELVCEDKEVDPKNRKRTLYTMLLTANKEKFQGVGQSKKAAREEAAKYALLKLFNFLYIPDASIASFVPEGTILGKRPLEESEDTEETTPKKRKKNKAATQDGPKNPVMRLNELRKNLEFTIESNSGPVHAPVFVMSLIVDGLKYEGCGSSKKKAKVDVAAKALNAIEPSVVEPIKCEPSTTT